MFYCHLVYFVVSWCILWSIVKQLDSLSTSERLKVNVSMNVFQELGHAYIPIGYIRLTSDKRAAQHGEISLAKQSDT
jgi:hypothetical protein